MKHPHAEIIKALADDESQTLWYLDHGRWFDYPQKKSYAISFVAHNENMQFHLGPTPPVRMIDTPYGSYPEPLREAPEKGTELWFTSATGAIQWGRWHECKPDMDCLRAGILHLTKEAAKQQAQVELKRRMAELGWEKS